MKITAVEANNRKKVFEVRTARGTLDYPYARLDVMPKSADRVVDVYSDPEAGREAFTYRLESGSEDTIHLDAVLEYHEDPAYLNEVLMYRLTLEARKAIEQSDLAKREVVRRLGTSPSQLYRLLDPGNSAKSAGQLLALLHLLGREVDVVVRPAKARGPEPTNVLQPVVADRSPLDVRAVRSKLRRGELTSLVREERERSRERIVEAVSDARLLPTGRAASKPPRRRRQKR